MPNLLVATRNPHKTRELRELLEDNFQLQDLTAHPEVREVAETGVSFEENATLKALAVSQYCSELIMADDSGLEVDALNGAPGVYSARYAGPLANDDQNIEKLLAELHRHDRGGTMRAARFRCVIVLAQNGRVIRTVEGAVEGSIIDQPRGIEGFGYDPVFQPAGYHETFGELGAAVKNRISHRAQAVRSVIEILASIAADQ
jgi:XTP/dITP diphosphohydrolase